LKVADLSSAELGSLLKRGDFLLDIHPFVARIRSNLPGVARDIALSYGEFPCVAPDAFADFHIEVARERSLRSLFRPQARFYYDGAPAFMPLMARQAFPMIEWGLNWCITAHAHQYLIMHAAVLEKDGRALIMPAPPGSGKSTLCAGLASRGWRLLSDELALYEPETGRVFGMARPINLKNRSIDVIKTFAPDAVLTEPVTDTIKGTVALMRPPAESVRRSREPALPAWVVLPKFESGSASLLVPHSRAETFMLLAEQSFNYDILGARGFEALGQIVDRSGCFTFTYSDLEDAQNVFERLRAADTQ
jgi:HprK-related kinase A